MSKKLEIVLSTLLGIQILISGCGGMGIPSDVKAAFNYDSLKSEEFSLLPKMTLNGNNPFILEVNTNFVDPGAKSLSLVYGDLSALIQTESSIKSSKLGVYSLIYRVSDPEGRSNSIERIVHVVDTQKPSLSLQGDNPLTIDMNSVYTEPGFQAFDNYDGSLTNSVTVTGAVNAFVAGTYQLRYDVSDSSQNRAETQIRTVIVKDISSEIHVDPLQIELCRDPFNYLMSGIHLSGAFAGANIQLRSVDIPDPQNQPQPGIYNAQYLITDTTGKSHTLNRSFEVSTTQNGITLDVAVYSKENLNSLQDPSELSSNLFLCNDLDFSGGLFSPIGSVQTPFSGTFEGNFHFIENLNILSVTSAGLFAANGGRIQNLVLKSVRVTGLNTVGALAGTNTGSIVNVGLIGDSEIKGGPQVGSLVGNNTGADARIERSFGTGLVSVDQTLFPTQNLVGGGLVGINQNSALIVNSFSQAFIEVSGFGSNGNISLGGLVGNNKANIEECYALAQGVGLQTVQNVGGIAGKITGGSLISSSFYNLDLSRIADPSSAGVIGLSDSQMKTSSSYSEWDFTSVWTMQPEAYPIFRWMLSR